MEFLSEQRGAMIQRFIANLMILVVAAMLCASSSPSPAGDGAILFESLKCGACHKPDKKAAGVSLAEIAKAYPDAPKLVSFFKGESPFLIESTKTGMMKGQLKNLATLSDGDKRVLAEYLLSFK
jgi:cytochrome c551/c552